jgi:hypothetical protein
MIHRRAIGFRPGAPLLAVHRPEFAAFVGPFVPDRHAMLVQPGCIGLAAQEPKQLIDDRLQVHFLRRDQRKSRGQIEAHLVTEHGQRARAGAVRLARAVLADVTHEVEIGLHVVATFPDGCGLRYAITSNAIPASSNGADSAMPIVTQPPAR